MLRKRSLLLHALAALLFVPALTASAAEIQLAGIKLGGSALRVVQKYGNPSEIKVGPAQQATMAGPEMPGYLPGVGSLETPSRMSAAMPIAPGAGVPPPPGLADMSRPGRPTAPVVAKKRAPEVTWIYRFVKNKTLEFIIDPEGHVIQIAAYGVEWPSIRTSKGITLGDTYKKVILSYGYPELHEQAGIELIARYAERHRAAFTFVGNQVVGITIALMD